MSTTDLTVQEVQGSVTGFDEIAIEKHMGMDMYTEAEAKPILLMRCLVFIHQVHLGKSATDAKNEALGMPLKAVNEYFAAPPEEVDPDAPETEAGKDSSALGSEPVASPPSVFQPE